MPQETAETEARRRARTPGPALRRSLLRLQQRRCPYSGETLVRRQPSSDHVIPLSRGGSGGLANILICSQRTNCDKNGHLPGPGIITAWLQHLDENRTRLERVALQYEQQADLEGCLGAAISVYEQLRPGETLWEGPGAARSAEEADREHILSLLRQAAARHLDRVPDPAPAAP